MKNYHARPRLKVTVGGRGVVAHADARLVAEIAETVGLTAALSAAMTPTRQRAGGHDRGRVLVDLAVTLADGGETISDLAVLRDQPALFGKVASTPTAWRALQAIDDAALSRIGEARAAARARAWAAGMDPGFYVIDIDATLIGSHSEKEQAAPTYKRGFGFHPLGAWLDATGEQLAMLLRPGNAGSGTAADHVTVLDAALAQLPVPASKMIARREDPHPGAQLTFTDIDGHRLQLMVTDLDDDDIAYPEALYRGRGRAERAICDANDLGLANLPSASFTINQAWLAIVGMAQDLLAWARHLTLDGDLARAEPKRLRYCLLHAAAQLVTSSRRRTLRIAEGWPGPPISSPPSTGSAPSATPSPAASPAPAGVRRRRGRRRRRSGPVPVPEPPRRRPRAAPRAHRGGVNEPGVPTGAGRGHGSRRSSWLSRAACRSWWSRSARFGASRAASA